MLIIRANVIKVINNWVKNYWQIIKVMLHYKRGKETESEPQIKRVTVKIIRKNWNIIFATEGYRSILFTIYWSKQQNVVCELKKGGDNRCTVQKSCSQPQLTNQIELSGFKAKFRNIFICTEPLNRKRNSYSCSCDSYAAVSEKLKI